MELAPQRDPVTPAMHSPRGDNVTPDLTDVVDPGVAGGAVALEREDDVALADRMRDGRESIRRELKKLIIGQDDVVEQVLMSLFVGGNSLIVGVPGLAK